MFTKVERVVLILGRIAWALLFAICAQMLSSIWGGPPRDEDGGNTISWVTVPWLGAVGITFLSPFLFALRGKLALTPVALVALLLALGATTAVSLYVFAFAAPGLHGDSAWAFALGNLPFAAKIFALGSLSAWVGAKMWAIFTKRLLQPRPHRQ